MESALVSSYPVVALVVCGPVSMRVLLAAFVLGGLPAGWCVALLINQLPLVIPAC